ncbi:MULTISPECIES: fumarylacetoacetase [unclassified Beijerinckia]|uniref:fumarylacetoacetase n=1 Tax=unclassified Beijerinckia TaxID=2638183 RepID=UPI00089C5418|nr:MULTISPECIES: fumarylacetoacetase [unclassified Beijerinckia]MDH7797700.1 fumarylacetoacetase [Beijerinckia sp. GAS462]SEC95433.1 fumarylacetoacetate hydrolase [Beijerinckia sp. 28-YEA-48]
MHPNDPSLRSFIEVAADSDFPIQNLPYGVISTSDDRRQRVAVAIGDHVLDLGIMEDAGLLPRVSAKPVFRTGSINALMANGAYGIGTVRRKISELLRHDSPTLRDNEALAKRALIPMKNVKLHRPVDVPGYTDFYSSREHATNVGTMFRGKDNALQENWLHIPIGYNGRASTVVVSGTPVIRPQGQLKAPGDSMPTFGPSKRLDIELEMGAIVGRSTEMGHIMDVDEAQYSIFGFALFNDWSARDIQQWEYVPLGPFQGKAFASTLGAWIVTKEALEPFAIHGPKQDPEPLPYLRQDKPHNYDIHLEVELKPANATRGTVISVSNFKYMYWSSAQQLAHHSSSGCAMSVGDLIGSGTISGPDKGSYGSMLELSWGGKEPIELVEGGTRTFLEDGDTITLRGYAQGEGYRIGFGEASGQILPAKIK